MLAETVMHIAKPRRSPTGQSYGEFLRAYRFFNKKLFEGALPDCLITLHRHRTAYGYFWGNRYASASDTKTDEIAMNPDHLRNRPDRVSLSTLVHEMAHLWQHHFGKSSRSGYHNKEWAEKMEALGLMPSSTGKPDGKRTGQKCSHYIIDGGRYDKACAQLLETGFRITWGSAPSLPKKGKSGSRVKYVCSDCSATVWGKSGLRVECADCASMMEPV
jgi:predicted SprT family Zn-dependent metalloprotease